MSITTQWLIFIALGYLLGGILFCKIIAEKFCHKDIVALSEDGNPGAANTFWQCGPKWGALGLIFDILKGFIPVFIASRRLGIDSIGMAFVILAPVLGHAYPIYQKFQGGGKCIATCFGVLLGVTWATPVWTILGALYLALSTVFKIRAGNVRALVTYLLFILASLVLELKLGQLWIGVGCVLISVIVIIRHLPLHATETASSTKAVKL